MCKLANLLFVYHFTLQENTDQVIEAYTLKLLLDLVSDSQTLFITLHCQNREVCFISKVSFQAAALAPCVSRQPAAGVQA